MSPVENKVVDLHLHSTASDGMDSPIELVRKAANNGLSAISITDHDTVSGINAALSEAGKLGIEVIPGVEFSVCFKPIMHILGLFVDIDNQELLLNLNKVKKCRSYLISKSFRILKNYGISVKPQDVLLSKKVLTIKNLSEYLIDKNIVTSKIEVDDMLSEIWSEWANCLPTPSECISLIHSCNGIAVLAHPQLLYLGDKQLKKLLVEMKTLGLDGIEVIHPDHTEEERRKLRELACELNLIQSGGSDYHGKNKRDQFSTIDSNTVIPYCELENMREYIKGRMQC